MSQILSVTHEPIKSQLITFIKDSAYELRAKRLDLPTSAVTVNMLEVKLILCLSVSLSYRAGLHCLRAWHWTSSLGTHGTGHPQPGLTLATVAGLT